MTQSELPSLLRASEVAAQLQISRPTVQRLAKAGAIPAPVLNTGRTQRWAANDIANFVRGGHHERS